MYKSCLIDVGVGVKGNSVWLKKPIVVNNWLHHKAHRVAVYYALLVVILFQTRENVNKMQLPFEPL